MVSLAMALLLPGCGEPCKEAGTVCSLVGTGMAGNDENEDRADRSPLYAPIDVAARDGAADFFIADWNNHKIRHFQEDTVKTVVGTAFLGDGDTDFKEREAPGVLGTTVGLNHPTQLEWNPVTKRLLLPSWHNHRVREFNPATGNSLVVCANTEPDAGNGANAGFAGDGGPAADALMAFPSSIAIDPEDGSFWLLAQKNIRIRKIAADFSLINSIAGTGEPGYEGDGGDPTLAKFNFWDPLDSQPEPAGSIEYADGKLYVADTANHVIRVIDVEANTIDTLPGTGTPPGVDENCDPDALCFPRDVEMGPDGLLYIADEGNHVIRAYDFDSESMETVVGTGSPGDAEDGTPPLEASLNRPFGIDVTKDGTLLIADTYNHRIRKVTP